MQEAKSKRAKVITVIKCFSERLVVVVAAAGQQQHQS